MSIINYPERVFRTVSTLVGKLMKETHHKAALVSKDITSAGINHLITNNQDWKINNINFKFSDATARDFSANIVNGVNVIQNYNDFLWFSSPTVIWQKIVLTPGFYSGTSLATELETKLTANAAWTAEATTFSVSYDNTTGIFTITPSAGTLKYIQRNLSQVLGQRDSIGGHLFGLTTNSVMDATVASDTPVYGLNTEFPFFSLIGNTSLYYEFATQTSFTMDQGVRLVTGTAAITVDALVDYSYKD